MLFSSKSRELTTASRGKCDCDEPGTDRDKYPEIRKEAGDSGARSLKMFNPIVVMSDED